MIAIWHKYRPRRREPLKRHFRVYKKSPSVLLNNPKENKMKTGNFTDSPRPPRPNAASIRGASSAHVAPVANRKVSACRL